MEISEIQVKKFLELLCGKVDELETYIETHLKTKPLPNKDGNEGTRERGKGISSLLEGAGTHVHKDGGFIPPKNYSSAKEFWTDGGDV